MKHQKTVRRADVTPCTHPRINIIRRIQYNEDRTAKVRDQCRLCLATRTGTRVDPENLPASFLASWKPREDRHS